VIWFDRDSARDLTAMLELRIRFGRRPRGLPVRVRVDRGRLRVRPGKDPDADVTAAVDVRDLIRLALGKARWPELISSGRLELAGDPFVALRFPAVFRLRA